MGNENGKELDVAQPDVEIHDKCKNGGVNGISVTITANGHTVEVPTKLPVENIEEPSPPEKPKTTEYVALDSQEGPTQAEDSIPTLDPIIPMEDIPPREEKVSLFSKMFKKKTAPSETENERSDVTDARKPDKDQQLPNGKVHEPHENGGIKELGANDTRNQVLAPTAIVEELSVPTNSTEYVVLESQSEPTEDSLQTPAPSEQAKPKEEKVSLFSKLFKKKTETATETEKPKEEETDVNPASDQQQPNGDIHNEQRHDIIDRGSAEEVKTTEYVVLESQNGPTEAEEATVQTPDPSEEIKPKEEKVSLFSKMFKKKTAPASPEEREKPVEEKTEAKEETDAGSSESDQQLETGKLEIPETDVQKVDEREESDPKQSQENEERDLDGGENVVENQSVPEEENPVMNFFKTLVTPTKSSKKEAPASDAPKDQPKPPETQPAPATTTSATATTAQVCDSPVAPKGMPAPPPPPPEPPRAEPAAKAKADEPKAATKDGPKGTSARDTLSRLFRSKTNHKDSPPSVDEAQTQQDQDESTEAPQTAAEEQTDSHVSTAEVTQAENTEAPEQKPDASKAATLEAAAKPAPAPAPAADDKKPEAKKSLFSFLKPKALLDSVSSTVQAASTSGVQLFRKTAAAATEAKAAPALAPAVADPGPAKEDAPKTAKAEATAEVKPTTAPPPGGEEAISPPKKLEKRNSITLFFKNLSQKRPSTDAGAPTEAAPAPSAEKTK